MTEMQQHETGSYAIEAQKIADRLKSFQSRAALRLAELDFVDL
jgi:hypothetical protein